jgi:hypothetical protein
MNKDLMAAYGEACVNAEIWNNKVMELKRVIGQEMENERDAKVAEQTVKEKKAEQKVK